LNPVFCYCDQWKKNIEIILIHSQFAYDFGYEETYKDFKYCPWCGNKLLTVEEIVEKKNARK
jgi:hypothetical protein